MSETKMAYRKNNRERRPPRHAFIFQVPGQKPAKVWTTVKPARAVVELRLTEEDVLQAMKRKGYGDAQNCAGAICTHRHGNLFSHPVSGHFDWLYRRLYVSDRNDAVGLPKSCVAYSHHDNVAKLFDSPAGLKKLLKKLREDGPMTIKLSPPVYELREAGRPRGGKSVPRRTAGSGGLKLRFTKMKAGMTGATA